MINTKKLIELKALGRFTPVILLMLSGFLFTECKRTSDGEPMLGSEYKPASANFAVDNNGFFQAYKKSDGTSTNVANFSTDSIFFKAGFNETVSWKITITGLTSGAEKTFSGVSDTVNLTNSTWDGGPSSVKFFKDEEDAVAELTFLGSAVSYKDTFKITSLKVYGGRVINGVYHIVVDNFDGLGNKIVETSHDFADDPYVFYGATNTNSVDASKSYHMYGKDVNSNSWLVGRNTALLGLKGFIGGVTSPKPLTDPSQIWVNLYVYGTGKINTSIQLKLYEEDVPTNTSDDYQQDQNDGYVYDLAVDWTGWKLVSVNYNSFKRASDPASGGNGNGIKNPDKVTGLAFNLGSLPTAGQDVEAYVDFIIITENGRFVP